MDIFLLVASIVMAFVLFLSSFYLLAVYCHPDDKGFGSGNYCKVIVVEYSAYSDLQHFAFLGNDSYLSPGYLELEGRRGGS